MARQSKVSGREVWIRLGAATRLVQLKAEMTAIHKAYPELRRGAAGTQVGSLPRPKRQMSAAAREAMSEGMRKYWAKRKAGGK
jgi:hypothetical protein